MSNVVCYVLESYACEGCITPLEVEAYCVQRMTEVSDGRPWRPTWATDLCDRPGRPTWATDLCGRPGRPTWATWAADLGDLGDRPGWPTWVTDLGGRPGRPTPVTDLVLRLVRPMSTLGIPIKEPTSRTDLVHITCDHVTHRASRQRDLEGPLPTSASGRPAADRPRCPRPRRDAAKIGRRQCPLAGKRTTKNTAPRRAVHYIRMAHQYLLGGGVLLSVLSFQYMILSVLSILALFSN